MPKKQPTLAADAVVFDKADRLLLIRRKNAPFKGRYALPGGFVEYGETVEAAAARELHEETGLKATSQRLVGVYSDPKRDPRGHTIAVAFLMTVEGAQPKGAMMRSRPLLSRIGAEKSSLSTTTRSWPMRSLRRRSASAGRRREPRRSRPSI